MYRSRFESRRRFVQGLAGSALVLAGARKLGWGAAAASGSRSPAGAGGASWGIASASGGVTVPFQVALQAHLAVGPGPIRRTATRQRALDLPAPATPPPANPITTILGLRDSLGCTPDQVAQLQAIADSLDARNRLLPESLDAVVRASTARDNAAWALERARAALTPEQWSKVPDALKSPPLVLND